MTRYWPEDGEVMAESGVGLCDGGLAPAAAYQAREDRAFAIHQAEGCMVDHLRDAFDGLQRQRSVRYPDAADEQAAWRHMEALVGALTKAYQP